MTSSVDTFIGAERLLVISHRCHIGYSANRLVVDLRDEPRTVEVPIGDVLGVVIETEQATITAAALAACGEEGVPVVICRRHLPVALSLPIIAGWNGAQMRRLQSRALRGDAPSRRLWRRTVRAKIFAQAAVMRSLGTDDATRVRRLADDVGLDGQEVVEAQAAAIYWRALFADYQRGDDDDPRNWLLNWGYAVLLATVGRGIVSLGFDPALGFGHSAQENAWALACDLMEPFRPTVDAAAHAAFIHDGLADARAGKARVLRLFANDGPVKAAVMATVRGYREFLDDGNETRVPYPDGALAA